MKISLIIPCYNEEQALYPLYEALQAAMQQLQEYSYLKRGKKRLYMYRAFW